MSFKVPEKYRVRESGQWSGRTGDPFGVFVIPSSSRNGMLRIIASSDEGWEHVSVSLAHRCPTWAEMCLVKDLFWDGGDCVMQLHPPESEYVNNHPYCLHLWRPVDSEIPRPPMYMVGIKSLGTLG